MKKNENKLCEICGKNTAEQIVVQYIDGVKKKTYVCSKCAMLVGVGDQLKKNGITLYTDYKLSHACSFCGWQLKDFMDTGLLGCPYCFIEFEGEVKTVIEHFHNVKTYDTHEKSSVKTKLMMLNNRLDKAVEQERFEDAAEIRDMIKKLRNY
ncbi:UvrB/UvrC motif-containing protein [bacterium]|nr:UvrB/UvrC motif-containing protein [bacterium]